MKKIKNQKIMKLNLSKITLGILVTMGSLVFSADDADDQNPLDTSFETVTTLTDYEQALTHIIPQAVFHDLVATKTVEGNPVTSLIYQRDCVENLTRNLLNMAFLFPSGELRPGAEEKILESPALASYYLVHLGEDLISSTPELGREWLEKTIGFEAFGVKYAQDNRELLTGIDNILALMEGFIPSLRNGGSLPGYTENQYRAYRLNKLCKYLSTETIDIKFNPKSIQNYEDATLKFTIMGGAKNQKEKVTLLIAQEHVCIRHRNEIAH